MNATPKPSPTLLVDPVSATTSTRRHDGASPLVSAARRAPARSGGRLRSDHGDPDRGVTGEGTEEAYE